MKILILGHGTHGKDTVAELLQKYGKFTFRSSSWTCAEALKPVLDAVNGEQSVLEHFQDRHKHRELWKRLISLYNAADPSALAQLILEKCDMYVGMRSMREYTASAHLFDLILWVDSSERVDYVDPTMEIPYQPATMLRVPNNGDLADLDAYIEVMALTIASTK